MDYDAQMTRVVTQLRGEISAAWLVLVGRDTWFNRTVSGADLEAHKSILNSATINTNDLDTTGRAKVNSGTWVYANWQALATNVHDLILVVDDSLGDYGWKAALAYTVDESGKDIVQGVETISEASTALTTPILIGIALVLVILLIK